MEKCRLCGFEWKPRVAEPRACPRCKRYDWDKAENLTAEGKDKLRSKKNREVAPLVGAEGVGGTPQPSAVGVSGLSGEPVNLTPYRPSSEPKACFVYSDDGIPADAPVPPHVASTYGGIPRSADFPNKIESKADVKDAVAKMSSSKTKHAVGCRCYRCKPPKEMK